MRGSQRSAAISEAIALHQPRATTRQNTRLHTRPQHTSRLVYFNVCVYDISDPDEPEPVEQLQAGETYLLTITCEDAPSTINQQIRQDGQPIAEHFTLGLSYAYDVDVASPITPAKESFSFEEIFHDQKPYKFTLPADLPSCTLTINIKLKTQQRPFPTMVVQYELPVCGQEIAASPIEIFEIAQIDQRLPDKTALLLVEPSTQPHQVRLRGWSEVGQQLNLVAALHVILSIEGLRDYRSGRHMKPIGPHEVLSRLTYFSRHCPPTFLRWLHMLLLAHQEPFNLIIVDLTEREIPWELVEIEKGLYLGAYACVVRWLPTQYFAITRTLAVQPANHAGPVISYLDTDIEARLIHDEQAALQLLAGPALPSLTALKQRLENSLDDVGMIYIGCHGRAGQHLLQQDVPELSSIMLESLYECVEPRLTVFINACESARTIKKSADDRSNFVDTFLGYCASGFIGPLAQIDIATASTIAAHILQAALQPGGVQIAELLRLLRKQALERLWKLKHSASVTRADYYRVVDTFMYVYYGNPLARLQLYGKEEAGQ